MGRGVGCKQLIIDAWVVPTSGSLDQENGTAEVEFPLGHDRPAPFHVASRVCLQDADHTP